MKTDMNRIGIIIFAAFTALSAIGEEKLSLPTLTAQGSNTFVFGHVKGGGVSNVIFRLKNDGATPLKVIRLYSSCPCLKAVCDKNDVPPGEETEIHAALNLAQVRGDFTRHIAVFSDKRGPAEVRLYLKGTVDPVVSGSPDGVVTLLAANEETVFTNSFDLTVNDPRYKLGAPRLKFPNGMNLDVALTDARIDAGNHVYGLTAVTSVQTRGQYRAEVVVPVIGVPQQEDVRILFQVHGGLVLFAAPQRLELQEDAAGEQRFRLSIRGSRSVALDPAKLTWQPKINGLSVKMEEARRTSSQNRVSKNETAARRPSPLTVMVTMTPEAANVLFESETPGLVFSYPDFGDVEVKVR